MLRVLYVLLAIGIIRESSQEKETESTDERPFCPCGSNSRSEDIRIVGGHNAGQGRFPFASCLIDNGDYERLRRILLLQNSGNVQAFCGATLITDSHILTAAHCFKSRPVDRILIDVGDYDLNSPQDRRLRRIKSVLKYPTYHDGSFYTDIAVVEFEPPVRWQPGVKAAILPDRDLELTPGTMVTAYGWGRLNYTGMQHPHILQSVELPVIANSDCQEKFKSHIEPHMLCAGGIPGHDACIGDSGSGLVVQEGNELVLVGVVSFGIKCGLPDVAGVYTRVPNFVDWILQHTHSSTCKPCQYEDIFD